MKVTGEPAQERGVQAGWVIFSVGGELAPQDTSQVTKLVMRMFKEKKDDIAGLVDFKFRVPIVDGFVHCIQVGDRRMMTAYAAAKAFVAQKLQLAVNIEGI